MRLGRSVVTVVVFLVSTIVCSTMALAGDCDYCVCKGNDTVNSCTKCCAAAQKDGSTITELKLRISDDGKAIVDQNGNDVARFVEGTRVQITTKGVKANSQKMQGCWRCYPACVIWEGNRCVEWMRTCDWDFDCK